MRSFGSKEMYVMNLTVGILESDFSVVFRGFGSIGKRGSDN